MFRVIDLLWREISSSLIGGTVFEETYIYISLLFVFEMRLHSYEDWLNKILSHPTLFLLENFQKVVLPLHFEKTNCQCQQQKVFFMELKKTFRNLFSRRKMFIIFRLTFCISLFVWTFLLYIVCHLYNPNWKVKSKVKLYLKSIYWFLLLYSFFIFNDVCSCSPVLVATKKIIFVTFIIVFTIASSYL